MPRIFVTVDLSSLRKNLTFFSGERLAGTPNVNQPTRTPMQTKLPCSVVRLVVTLLLTLLAGSVVPAAQAALKIIYETQKLTDPDGGSDGSFGSSVSISGNSAIVGNRFDPIKGFFSGSASIFAFDGTSWNLQAKLTASDEVANQVFGSAVAISGNMAFVGSPSDSTLASLGGAVYVFTFDGTTWTQQAKLFASDTEQYTSFGASIALSGNTALIGSGAEAVYVFTFDGTSWSEQAKLTASDGGDDGFGTSVSLSENRALVGAPFNGLGGAAYIFSFNGTSWSEDAKLTGLDTRQDDNFGSSVSLSGDLALIGAPDRDQSRGAAYIFAFDGMTWSQQTKLKLTGGQKYDNFGDSVALSGTVAIVGAHQFLDPGAVYEFSLRRNIWTLRAQLLASGNGEGNYLGVSVALSGTTVLAGADDTFNATESGAAYIFSLGRQR
jgi:hypothetical protein